MYAKFIRYNVMKKLYYTVVEKTSPYYFLNNAVADDRLVAKEQYMFMFMYV